MNVPLCFYQVFQWMEKLKPNHILKPSIIFTVYSQEIKQINSPKTSSEVKKTKKFAVETCW